MSPVWLLSSYSFAVFWWSHGAQPAARHAFRISATRAICTMCSTVPEALAKQLSKINLC